MSRPTPQETAEALRRAAGVLEGRGWVRDALSDASGRMCPVGAIFFSSRRSWPASAAINTLAAYITSHGLALSGDDEAFGTMTVTLWNDGVASGLGEVVEVMEKAALWVEEVGFSGGGA